ncbi:hypothetical protein M8C21_016324, partial [Ambrosia artemisiifolia]
PVVGVVEGYEDWTAEIHLKRVDEDEEEGCDDRIQRKILHQMNDSFYPSYTQRDRLDDEEERAHGPCRLFDTNLSSEWYKFAYALQRCKR